RAASGHATAPPSSVMKWRRSREGRPLLGAPRAGPYVQLSRIRLLPPGITANVCPMRSTACDTLARPSGPHVLCWPALPLVSALRSTGSAAVTSTADCSAGCSALFAFTATMAKSDFPRPSIIGYGSSPSRCGPGRHMACGQTRDIPRSNAIPLRVMWPSTPAGRQCLAWRHFTCCIRPLRQSLLPRVHHFVAHFHTPPTSCVLFVFGVTAASRNTRFQAARYGLAWVGLAPTDRASFAWRLPSFDHLVGAGEKRRWNVDADRLSGLEIDN